MHVFEWTFGCVRDVQNSGAGVGCHLNPSRLAVLLCDGSAVDKLAACFRSTTLFSTTSLTSTTSNKREELQRPGDDSMLLRRPLIVASSPAAALPCAR
jgi:hypothetical protein